MRDSIQLSLASIYTTSIARNQKEEAEDALRESDEHLHLALKSVNSGAWEWDLLTNENSWSDELWKLYGLEPHSCVPSYEAWRQTIHPDDRENTEKKIQEAAHEGSELNVEWRVVDRDGAVRWLISRGSPFRDVNGKVVRFSGIVLDITERKRAESEISMLSSALKSINECVSITDTNNTILFVNQSFLETYGYRENELLGKNMDIVRSANSPPEIMGDILSATLRGGWHGEIWNRRKDGTEFLISLSTKIIRGEGAQPIALIGIATDITERKQAEELIQRAASEWQTTFDAVNDSVCLLDEQQKILRCNKSTVEMFGKSYDEMKGQYCWKMVHGTDKPLPECPTIRMQKSLRRERAEIQQGEKWLEAVVDPILDESGKLKSVIHIVRDITERKQTQEKILKANRVYAVISQINQAIVRTRERDKLFEDVCRIAIEHGKFQMAWIGLVDEETKLVNPVTFAGIEDGYLSKIKKISIRRPAGRTLVEQERRSKKESILYATISLTIQE